MRGFTLLCFLFLSAFGVEAQDAKPAIDVHPKILIDSDWKFLRLEPEKKPANSGVPVPSWQWTFDEKGAEDADAMTKPEMVDTVAPWQTAKTGEDVFKGKVGFAWFRTTLPAFKGKTPTIHFEGVDDNADVYLNGKLLTHHEGWNEEFDVPLGSAWSKTGPNLLAISVENVNGPGGIIGAVGLSSGEAAPTAAPAFEMFDDSSWRSVHLPHDYVVEGKFSPKEEASHGSLPKPMAWYRKTFLVPDSAKGKSVAIQFDGVYRNSEVWINGHDLGVHSSGYTGFRHDITDYVHYGHSNVIAVRVDPRHDEGWWYEGGGIYRHVWLDISPRVSIAPNGVFVTTKMDEPQPGVEPKSAEITVLTGLVSRSKQTQSIQVNAKILDEQDSPVALASTLVNFPTEPRTTLSLTIDKPKLWSIENPYLYRVKTEIEVDGVLIDSRVTSFGVRTTRFDPEKGFFLNGQRVEIQGTCNHQDFAGIGIAVPDSLEYWRVQKLKEMGCNAWRMSHNPPTPSVLDACDRLGMLVMDENRHLGDSPEVLSQVANMVQRDRNHPSVIMWSMCNEEAAQGTARGAAMLTKMRDTVLKFDTTRPVSSAMNGGWFDPGFVGVEDLMGVNYNYEVYQKFHDMHPTMPLFGSETASVTSTRGEYANDKTKAYVTSYNMVDGSWKPAGERPFVAGTFVWTGFDYKGEPSPYEWPAINSAFGIMDMCGFPKDSYYYYQSWWKSKPVVHIMPHWNWPGQEGKEIQVIVFSNSPKVELSLNGTVIGVKEMPRMGHLEWPVKYAPGILMARGIGADGATEAMDKVVTTGPAARVRLTAHRSTLVDDGEDMVVVTAELLDSMGRVCPTAGNFVDFNVDGSGYIAGVGNGNPGDHDPDKGNKRRAFNGKCVVVVGSGEKTGKFQLTASSVGLKGASLSFEVIPKP